MNELSNELWEGFLGNFNSHVNYSSCRQRLSYYNSKTEIKKEDEDKVSNISEDDNSRCINQFKIDIKDVLKLPKNQIEDQFDD